MSVPLAQETSQTIFCLLGTSRCGSTLLQSAIARHFGAIALGEIARVHELIEKQSICGCGKKLVACPFWVPALPDLQRMTPIVAWRATSWHTRSILLRSALAAAMGHSVLASPTERQSAAALGQALARLAEQTGRSLFVDSSKEPAEFFRLTLLPSLRIVPVHLIRDPRAVAWSGYKRTGIDPMAMAKHWARLNLAIASFKRLTQRYPWQIVLHENFCATPGLVLQKLHTAAKHKEESEGFGLAVHALGGSPGFSGASDSIVLDERWKAEMPRALQQHIMQTIGYIARMFGYS